MEVGLYDTKITISNPNIPISEIESVYKITYDSFGHRQLTLIDPSNVEYIAGATEFTITGATDGDRYKYTYYYPQELSTIPTIEYSVPINMTGQIDGNTSMIGQNASLINKLFEQIKDILDLLEN